MFFVHRGNRRAFIIESENTQTPLIVNDFTEARDEMSTSRRNGAKKLLTTKKRFSQQWDVTHRGYL